MEDISKQLENDNLSEDKRVNLSAEWLPLYDVRKSYYERVDEITDARDDLKEQKQRMNETKSKITGD